MSKETRKRKQAYAHKHRFKKIKREIDGLQYHYFQCQQCYRVEYPLPELQKIYEYSQKHTFMFIQDWILTLLYTTPEAPVVGITNFEKMLFLTLKEFAQEHEIPTENAGFRGYKFGPYSERIEDVLIGLEEAGLIQTEGRRGTKGEYFTLTDKGKEIAQKTFEKLTKEQQETFREQRIDWHELGTDGLEKYIYKKYPEFTKESLILERVLHRRRMGQLPKEKEEDHT